MKCYNSFGKKLTPEIIDKDSILVVMGYVDNINEQTTHSLNPKELRELADYLEFVRR